MRALALLSLAVAAPLLTGAMTDGTDPLPRDRQALLERHIGHLSPVDNVRCIQRRRIAEAIIISDQRILYRASRGLVFDAALNPGCERLVRSPYAPRTNARGSQLCAGDSIEVVSPGDTASCTISGFTRWERAATD